ncbi:MAG: hypothetical protein AB1814_02185 [Thermodesulfobacteriota bacterium]
MKDIINWFDEQIPFLSARVGIYRLNEKFFFDPTPRFYMSLRRQTNIALNEALMQLGGHIHVPILPSILYSEIDEGGQIIFDKYKQCSILISSEISDKPELVAAIMAHELAHYYLMIKGIGLSSLSDNEQLTDVATVFLGLGKLTLNGFRDTKGLRSLVGYLSSEEVGILICRICTFRNIHLVDAEEFLFNEARKTLMKSARNLMK